MSTEIELKFAGSPELLAAVRRLPCIRASVGRKPDKKKIASVYFDTPESDLRCRGLTLRIRKTGRKRLQTIKSASAGSTLARDEWEEEIHSDKPDFSLVNDTPLAGLLTRKWADSIRPVFETVVERTVFPVCAGPAEIELAIDHGWIRSGRRRQSLSEIELELKQGDLDALRKLAAELADAVPVSFEVRSKAERGYALGANEWHGPVRAGAIHLDPEGKVADAFRTIGFSCLHHLAANRNAVLKGVPEGIHQMRIGARRLRAAISAFNAMLESAETDWVKTELKWLTDQLAPARDFHVLLTEVLLPLRGTEASEPGVELLIADIEQRRDAGLKAAKAALRSERYRECILRTALWLTGGEWWASKDPLSCAWRDRPVRAFAREVLRHDTAKIRKKGKRLQQLDQAHRHKLRIATKKLRYATEFFASLFLGNKAKHARKRFGDALKEVQNALGRLNDIAVHQKLAGELAVTGEHSAERSQEAYAFGLFIGREQGRAHPFLTAATRAVKKLTNAKSCWR